MSEFRIQHKFPGEKAQNLVLHQASLAGVLQVLRNTYHVEVETSEQLIIHEILPDGKVKICMEHEDATLSPRTPSPPTPSDTKPHVMWSSKYNKFMTVEELRRYEAIDQALDEADQVDDYYAGTWDEWADRGGWHKADREGNRNYSDVYEEKEKRILEGVVKLIESDPEPEPDTKWKRHQKPRERYKVRKYGKQ